MLVVSDEHDTFVRGRLATARLRGIPTFHVLDGAVRWQNLFDNPRSSVPENGPSFLQPLMAECTVVIGPMQAQILRWLGNPGVILPLGLPRLDGHRRAPCRMGGPEAGTRLLIATNNTPWYTDSQREFFEPRFRELVKRLLDACRRRNLPVAVRPSNLGPNLSPGPECWPGNNGTRVPFTEDLTTAAAVITTPSTIAIEAMLAGIPTLVYDPYADPMLNPSAWYATSVDTVIEQLDGLVAPSMPRARYQDSLVATMVVPKGGASERLIQAMMARVSGGPEALLALQDAAHASPVAVPPLGGPR